MKFSAVLCLAIVLCVAVYESSAKVLPVKRDVIQTLEFRFPNRHQSPNVHDRHLTKDIRPDDLPSAKISNFYHEHDDAWLANFPQYAKFERKNQGNQGSIPARKPTGGGSGIYEV